MVCILSIGINVVLNWYIHVYDMYCIYYMCYIVLIDNLY